MYGTTDELKLTIGFQATAMAAGKDEGEFDEEIGVILGNVSDVIDGMISTRVAPADVANNAVLKRIALAIARFDVFTQYARTEVPETIREDKKEAMKLLADIQAGKLSISLDNPAEGTPTTIEPEFNSNAAVFGTVML